MLRGVAVLRGVGDVVAFVGVADGEGDLCTADAADFDFGVGVGFGVGVCALRSTPRRVPRPTEAPVLATVAEGFARGLKAEKKDFFGFGVGVGVGAALSDKATLRSSNNIGQKIRWHIIQLALTIFLAAPSVRAMLNALCQKKF